MGDQPAPLPILQESPTPLLEDPELFLTPLTMGLKIEETPSELVLCKSEQMQDETVEVKSAQCWEGSEKFSSYNVGHLSYVATLRTPIFGQSRCFERTKRRKGNNETYFTFIAKSMQARKNNRPDTQYAKRYDQGLQDKLADHDRLKMDITVMALRDAARKIHKPQQAAVIAKLSAKYRAKRHWAQFLANFVNQAAQEESWNIPALVV